MVGSKAPEHNADHGETDEGSNGGGIALEVARQASVAADPCERPLDDPAFWQNLKSANAGIGSMAAEMKRPRSVNLAFAEGLVAGSRRLL
jgi:hypothetical protein